MDAGDYGTNTLILNNISSIAYNIYEPVATASSPYTFHASDVECALRKDGHLVYMDAERRGVWCFYLVGKDGSTTPSFTDHAGLGEALDVCGYHLQLVTQGAFEPGSLPRGLSSGTPGIHSPRATNTPTSALSSASALDFKLLDTKGYNAVPVIQKHSFFINSLLSVLSTAFCRASGAISLTKRTLLLPAEVLEPKDGEWPSCPPLAALATFRIYLTTTDSLVINLTVSAMEGLVSAADTLRLDLPTTPVSGSVLAAPIGWFATAQSVLDRDLFFPDSISGQTPDTQIMTRFRPDISDKIAQWKILLDLHGISPSILEGCSWINLQALRKKPHDYRDDANSMASPMPMVYAWPSALCFRRRNPNQLLSREAQGMLMGNGEAFDPLGTAKDWFETSNGREELFSNRRKREQQESAVRQAAEVVDGRIAQPNISSPLALARASMTGATSAGVAAGAMYPTPPDGVQLPPGATSSLDGTISSPPTQPSVPTMVETDPGLAMSSDGQLGGASSYAAGWNGEHMQQMDHERTRAQPNTTFFEGENVFGDLGEDLFENNELTDADFNYFDEVDQGPGDGSGSGSGSGLTLSGLQQLNMESELHDIDMDDAIELATNLALEQAAVNTSYNNALASTEPRLVAPPSPVFAKPELKHARSTLGGEEARQQQQQINTASYKANVATGRKRQASPFDPNTVYKRVRASLSGSCGARESVSHQPGRRRSSVFEKMDFDPSLSLVAKKYQESGPFQFNLPSRKEKADRASDEPSLATVPRMRPYSRKVDKAAPASAMQYGDLMDKITATLQKNSLSGHPGKQDEFLLDEDEDSLVSDQDDSSQGTGEPSSPTKSTTTRTRLADDDNMSLAGSFKDVDHGTAMVSPAYAIGDLSTLPQPGEPDVSVPKYFSDPEPWPLRLSCPDEDLVAIAQILTEQAVSGSLLLGSGTCPADGALQETRRSLAMAARYSIQCLHSVLPSSLGNANECLFKPFVEMQDVPIVAQPVSKMQPRPVVQDHPLRPSLFQIATPHVEIRRNDSKLSVLPTAVAFWESLGLSPAQGSKDISAVCVFPDWKGMQDNVAWFLERIRSSYGSLKMGAFERMPSAAPVAEGLFPYAVDRSAAAASPYPPATPRPGSALAGYMANLAQEMAALTVADKNIVVYFVYTPQNPSSIVEACAAFQELFEKYKRALSDRERLIVNDLVLQLIPLDTVASESALAILTPADYTKLCLETYDRCTLFGGPMPAPAIVLEQALPNRIDFRMSTNPPAHVLHENSCIHIAYARSVDDRWITAAWTDNRGSKQMTASYCLGRRGKRLSNALVDILHEIWETTHDLTSVWSVHWRVMISKCGPMEHVEVDYWMALAKNETRTNINLCLLTVDTNPSLQLIPPPAKIPANVPVLCYTTPVSTPGPISTVSPEQSGNASTPMGAASSSMSSMTPGGDNNVTEPDADSTLVDATEITWGAIMAHRLNNSTSLTELNPAWQSGYLVKRSSIRPEDPPVLMEVSLVYTSECNNPRTYETLLREVLIYYRGLGTLARLRGMVDRETDVRPWHIAAAEKGVKAVYQLM